MLKVYGSKMCPDCVALKMNFDFYGIEYEFLDINETLRNLKEFLIIRDKNPVFLRCKEIHDIGLPACIDEDGNVFLDWETYLKKRGFNPLSLNGQSCSKDGKGC